MRQGASWGTQKCSRAALKAGSAVDIKLYLFWAGSGSWHAPRSGGLLEALRWQPRSWRSRKHLLRLLLLKGGLQGHSRHGLLLLLEAWSGNPLLRWKPTLHGREPSHLGWSPWLLPHLGQGPLLARVHRLLGRNVLALVLLHERGRLLLLGGWQLLWQLLLGLEGWCARLLHGHRHLSSCSMTSGTTMMLALLNSDATTTFHPKLHSKVH